MRWQDWFSDWGKTLLAIWAARALVLGGRQIDLTDTTFTPPSVTHAGNVL